jgi:hypothetical protein
MDPNLQYLHKKHQQQSLKNDTQFDNHHDITCITRLFHPTVNQWIKTIINNGRSATKWNDPITEKSSKQCKHLVKLDLSWHILYHFASGLWHHQIPRCRQEIHLNPLWQTQTTTFEQSCKIITHDIATVIFPTEYSMINAQPIIQAIISPKATYEYV